MRHEVVGSGAMPVPLIRGCDDDIAGPELLDPAAAGLHQPSAFGDVEGLADGVGVPGGAGRGGEPDGADPHPGGLLAAGDGVDEDIAGEPFGRTLGGRLLGLHRHGPLLAVGSDTSWSASFDPDGEVLALALDRVQLAVELADPDDTVEERGVAVVVEHQVAAWRPVADVSGGGIVPFGRALERQLAGKRSGLLDAVVVAEAERQRQLTGQIACRGVVVQPRGELRIAEGDPNRRALRGAGLLVIGGWARGAGLGSAGRLVSVLVLAPTSRERDRGEQREDKRVAASRARPPEAEGLRSAQNAPLVVGRVHGIACVSGRPGTRRVVVKPASSSSSWSWNRWSWTLAAGSARRW